MSSFWKFCEVLNMKLFINWLKRLFLALSLLKRNSAELEVLLLYCMDSFRLRQGFLPRNFYVTRNLRSKELTASRFIYYNSSLMYVFSQCKCTCLKPYSYQYFIMWSTQSEVHNNYIINNVVLNNNNNWEFFCVCAYYIIQKLHVPLVSFYMLTPQAT